MVMCAAPSLRDGGRLLTRGSANRCRNDQVISERGDCRSCLCGMGEDCFGKQAAGDANDSHLRWDSAQFQLNQTFIDDRLSDYISALCHLERQTKQRLEVLKFQYHAAS